MISKCIVGEIAARQCAHTDGSRRNITKKSHSFRTNHLMCTSARMIYPRPASTSKRGRRSHTASSNPDDYGKGQEQQALLDKIELLAIRHARNVDALQRLRGSPRSGRHSAPTNTWEDGGDLRTRTLPPSYLPLNRVESGKRRPSTGDGRSRSACGLFEENTVTRPSSARSNYERHRRSYTRVISSTKSSWKNEPTVVKPFRSMEAHASAWKRKVRQQDEVRQIRFPLNDRCTIGCFVPLFWFWYMADPPGPLCRLVCRSQSCPAYYAQ